MAAALVLSSMSSLASYDHQLGLLNGSSGGGGSVAVPVPVPVPVSVQSSSHLGGSGSVPLTHTLPQVFVKPSPPTAASEAASNNTNTSILQQLPTKFV
ncbi:yemanuclein [Drosophila madeirensis]|uniref:Yemanuclein n=1 Tax=Drosophila madeirensis TaxID=30013 RepID=A0AAU9FAD8_DROMD